MSLADWCQAAIYWRGRVCTSRVGRRAVLHWVIDVENKHITSSNVFVCHIGVYTISIAQVESVRQRALKDQEEKTWWVITKVARKTCYTISELSLFPTVYYLHCSAALWLSAVSSSWWCERSELSFFKGKYICVFKAHGHSAVATQP